MSLFEKVMVIYPQITDQEVVNYIRFRNDSDGEGDYIAKWDHPTLPQPTQEQLDAVVG